MSGLTESLHLLYFNLTSHPPTEVHLIADSEKKLTGHRRLLIVLILIFGLINGMMFITLVPKWQAPDEPRYFGEIQTVAEDLKIPGITTEKQIDHPPLYYLAATPFYYFGGLWGEKGSVLTIRFFGLIQLLIVAFLTFLIAREVFPENTFLHYGAPTLIVLNPQLVFITGSVQSDGLLNTFCALLFYQGVLAVKNGLNIKRVLLIALIAIGGIFTKERFAIIVASFFILMVLITIRWLWSKRRTTDSPEPFTRKRGLGISSAIFSVIFISVTFSISAFVFTGNYKYLVRSAGASNTLDFRSRMFKQFWGTFGWFDIPLSDRLYETLDYFTLFALAGIIASIIGFLIRHVENRDTKEGLIKNFLSLLKKTNSNTLIVMIFFISSIVLTYTATSYYDTFGGAGGRYIFIVSVPLTILMTYGISRLIPKGYGDTALTALFSGFFLFNLVVIYNYIVPFYY